MRFTTETSTSPEKLLCLRKGTESGPLLIVIGQMHGNEPAGTAAIQIVNRMLDDAAESGQAVGLRGVFAGICGNLAAARAGLRYHHHDLNRLWHPENVARVLATPLERLHDDERELSENLRLVRDLREAHPEAPTVLLDLHTTTAKGGVFAFPSDDAWATELAGHLLAPVIHGMLNYLSGTALHYFTTERFPPRTAALAFEAGQHSDPHSIGNAGVAILQTMRALGMIGPDDLRLGHELVMPHYSEGVPRHLRLIYRHPVLPDDRFVMRPGYRNFQPVQRGELLANDAKGAVLCPADGYLLMPLYQKQGNDGFFLLEEEQHPHPNA